MAYVEGWVVIAEPLISKKPTIQLTGGDRWMPDCYAVYLTRKKAREALRRGVLPNHPRKIYKARVVWKEEP